MALAWKQGLVALLILAAGLVVAAWALPSLPGSGGISGLSGGPEVTRTVPDSAARGQLVRVSINISSRESLEDVVVTEEVEGATVRGSRLGTTTNGTVTWELGSVSPGTRTLEYAINVPIDAVDDVTFSGVVETSEGNLDIEGENVLEVS